jgi:hypothetical protein
LVGNGNVIPPPIFVKAAAFHQPRRQGTDEWGCGRISLLAAVSIISCELQSNVPQPGNHSPGKPLQVLSDIYEGNAGLLKPRILSIITCLENLWSPSPLRKDLGGSK